jgi:DNA-binding IclR family transcriptional regulator
MANSVQPSERVRAGVPSINAACRVLDALARAEGDGPTLSGLARELGLSKSSLHGILATLQSWGYVRRDAESRRYRLGAALVSLGRAATSQTHATSLVRERLSVLAGEHHLTFAVAQVTGYGDAQVIDRAYPQVDVHVGVTIGSRYGWFDGAIGKCLLAALEPSEVERLARTETIPRHTDRTIVDPDALIDEIAAVRAQGYSASAGELKENRAVAVPLRDLAGNLELILLAVGFPGQLADDAIPSVGAVLRETARAVETAIGVPDDDQPQ